MIDKLVTPIRKLFLYFDKLIGISREGKRSKARFTGIKLHPTNPSTKCGKKFD